MFDTYSYWSTYHTECLLNMGPASYRFNCILIIALPNPFSTIGAEMQLLAVPTSFEATTQIV